eukprot:m.135480 g.135480  ORF g.135480 m.135480 type:complete len:567 (-) comp29798_c0_seq2:290-1990(-)
MANQGSIKPIYVPKPIYEEKASSSDTNPFAHFTDDSNATFSRDNISQPDEHEDSPLPEAPSAAKEGKSKKTKGAKSFKFWGKKKKSQDKLIDDEENSEEFASFPDEQGTHNATHSTDGTGGDYHNGAAFDQANALNKEYGGFDDDDVESTTSAVVKGSSASVVIESDTNQNGQESPYGVIKPLGNASTSPGYNPTHEPEDENEGAYGEIKPFENAAAPNASSLASALTFHVKEEDSLYSEMVPDADVVEKEAALDKQRRDILARRSVSSSSLMAASSNNSRRGSANSSLASSPNRSPSLNSNRKSIIQDRDLPGVPANKRGISRNVGRRGTMAPHMMVMKKAQVRGTGGADDEVSDIAKGFVGGMDHLTVQDYVLGSMPGDFLVRDSSSSKNLVLCVNDRRRLANYKIEALPKGEYKFYGRNFSDLDHVIEFASLNLKSLVKATERLVLQNPATVEKWFVGETEKARVETAVAAGEHGQFLVRKSSSYTSFVVCVNDQGSIGNFLIDVDKQTGGYLFGNFKFKSLRKTIGWFQSSPIKGPKTHQLTITTPVELEWTNIDNLDAYDL